MASCSVAQTDDQGVERAAEVALPSWPQSAAAAEMCAIMAALDILARGTPEGEPREHASLRAAGDCSAVISASLRAGAGAKA